ncbi:MAG: type IV pili methyl-accepting chemotaxis transducer N-terminal domain-containing protein, partial [Desulfobacteraceae bacterium]|nr:type IV pili methyl-accepting chemotaxis transducer N-terminal domain-containing protein [Desulfobacteraceae bacterium]
MNKRLYSLYSINYLIPILVFLMFMANAITIAVSIFLISLHKTDGAVINMSGRQRMLSQKMAKDACIFLKTGDQRVLSDLKDSSSLFEASLKALKDGDEQNGIPPATDDKVISELNKLEGLWKPFYSNIDMILTAKNGSPEANAALDYLSGHNEKLLNQSDMVTKLLEERSEAENTYFKIFEYIMLSCGLIWVIALIFITKKLIITPFDNIISAI